MKRLAILTSVLCLSLVFAGCANNKKTAEGDTPVTTEAATAEAVASSHQVIVEDLTREVVSRGEFEYISSCPKLIVDGVEATEINTAISEHVQKTYPFRTSDEYVDGYETLYKWGVKDNTVSIVIFALAVGEDYYTVEVYNYDLDTLEPLEDTEVAKRLGMTDEEFFDRTAEIFNERYGGIADIDLEKSIAQIDYYNITPYITPEGNAGVAACIYYAPGSQFYGMESMRCFEMN